LLTLDAQVRSATLNDQLREVSGMYQEDQIATRLRDQDFRVGLHALVCNIGTLTRQAQSLLPNTDELVYKSYFEKKF
jgi:hypothetical protein